MKPLGLLRSVVYFGASALLFRLCVYQLLPLLMQYMPQFWAFIISYTLPLSAFILATFLLLRKESTLSNWKSRLRLKKLTIKQAAVSFGIFVVGFLLTGLLLPTAQYLASTNWFAFPSFLPDIQQSTCICAHYFFGCAFIRCLLGRCGVFYLPNLFQHSGRRALVQRVYLAPAGVGLG